MSDEHVNEATVETPEVEEIAEGVVAAVDSGKGLDDLDKTQLIEMITELRTENGSKRVKNRELNQKIKEDAQKWTEYLDSQKSDLERATERAQALEAEVAQYKLERLQKSIAKEFGLNDDLVEFIVGADEKEMRAKAKKLAETTKPAVGFGTGGAQAGVPITPKRATGGSFLQSL